MKPVLILQHMADDGPAYLGTWLHRQAVPHELHNAGAGQAFPERMDDFSALAVLGGEMSANDPLPTLRQAERLILQAFATGRPVIGHCLGGQLMARALGARIGPSPAPEIGWQGIEVADSVPARDWFGAIGPHQVFQWHFEAFALPEGAQALAGSTACPVQAFAYGPHLAMQFHVEVDAEKLVRWSRDTGARYLHAQKHHRTVQSGSAMCDDLAERLRTQQALADRFYGRWLGAAARQGNFP